MSLTFFALGLNAQESPTDMKAPIDRSANALAVWKNIAPEKQEQLLSRWENFKRKELLDRNRIRASFEAFDKLPAHRQSLVQKNYEIWKTLSPEQKEVVKSKWVQWHQLSEADKKKFFEKFGEKN
jgi:hypothetical protein